MKRIEGCWIRSAILSPSQRSSVSPISTKSSSTRGSTGHAGSGVDLTRDCIAVFGVLAMNECRAVARCGNSSRRLWRSWQHAPQRVSGLAVMAAPSFDRPSQLRPDLQRASGEMGTALEPEILGLDLHHVAVLAPPHNAFDQVVAFEVATDAVEIERHVVQNVEPVWN